MCPYNVRWDATDILIVAAFADEVDNNTKAALQNDSEKEEK